MFATTAKKRGGRKPDPNAQQNRRNRNAARRRHQTAEISNVGTIRPIVDIRRRARCRKSLRRFIETYNPDAFTLEWSEDHLRVIARIEEAATVGALYALAMPRGSGKTSICRMAALWAISYGHRRYAFLIGANASKARETLSAIKVYIRRLPLYAEDFPEIAQAAEHLDGKANRAIGQHCNGVATMIQWGQDAVVLPTVPPPENWPKAWPLRSDGMVPTSGAALSASGLTGDGIRGSLLTLTTGEGIRPDFVLLDDPQTHESAHSANQNETRERLVSADVLGMAGPGKSIAAVMPCTVIAPDDFIDRILDRKQYPLWRGERTKMMPTMPKNMGAWEKYFDAYRVCVQKEPPDIAEANAYYLDHRAELDDGATISWPARKLPEEVSAVQHAMHLYFRDPIAFDAEYQNSPRRLDQHDAGQLDALAIRNRLNRLPRGIVPPSAMRLTAFIDIQGTALFWLVAAWEKSFTGSVVDYGCFPDQGKAYFTLREVQRTLQDAAPGAHLEGAIYAGLSSVTSQLLGKEWPRGNGHGLSIERCLIDSGWGNSSEVVHRFCRQSQYSGVLSASKGRGITASSSPMSEWQERKGELRGWNWRQSPTQEGRLVLYDTNAWKTFTANRLTSAMGDSGSLTLFGDDPSVHKMLSDHLTAEYRIKTEGRGREVDEWKPRVEGRDNHWLDCLVGSAVAASMLGCELGGMGQEQPKRRVSYRELQQRAREKQRRGKSA